MDKIEKEDLAQLIDAYRKAAIRHTQATEKGDSKTTNKAADVIADIYRELRRRGLEAQQQLLPLLMDISPGVRCWAAAHAMEFAPDKGEPILKKLVSSKGIVSFGAEIVLEGWREGRLRFP